jgi:hypothetical protein
VIIYLRPYYVSICVGKYFHSCVDVYRSEEYTFTLDQSVVVKVFHGVPHLQAAQLQSPYLVHNLLERMRIEKMRRNDALGVMMRLGQSVEMSKKALGSFDQSLESGSVDSILTGIITNTPSMTSAYHLPAASGPDEEDRVRVITLRGVTTNGE